MGQCISLGKRTHQLGLTPPPLGPGQPGSIDDTKQMCRTSHLLLSFHRHLQRSPSCTQLAVTPRRALCRGALTPSS